MCTPGAAAVPDFHLRCCAAWGMSSRAAPAELGEPPVAEGKRVLVVGGSCQPTCHMGEHSLMETGWRQLSSITSYLRNKCCGLGFEGPGDWKNPVLFPLQQSSLLVTDHKTEYKQQLFFIVSSAIPSCK